MKTILIGIVVVAIIVGVVYILQPKSPASYQTGNEVASGTTSSSETPSTQGNGAPKTTTPTYVPPKADAGRIVVAIADAAINIDNIKSVFITTTNVQLHNDQGKWVTISTAPKTFDLLELKRTGSLGLLANVSFDKGSYNQLRLTVSGVQVVLNDGTTHTAKLPSGEIHIVGLTTIEKAQTSAITFDFEVDRSLHITGDKTYIFAPVLKTLTRTSVSVEVLAQGKVRLLSGAASIEHSVGMDENGVIKDNFAIDQMAQLDIVDNVIKIRPQGTDEGGVQIGASQALSIVRNTKSVDTALSIKLVMRDSAKIWRVTGTKGGALVTVDVNAATGAILQ